VNFLEGVEGEVDPGEVLEGVSDDFFGDHVEALEGEEVVIGETKGAIDVPQTRTFTFLDDRKAVFVMKFVGGGDGDHRDD